MSFENNLFEPTGKELDRQKHFVHLGKIKSGKSSFFVEIDRLENFKLESWLKNGASQDGLAFILNGFIHSLSFLEEQNRTDILALL